jgi:hypothetical protein
MVQARGVRADPAHHGAGFFVARGGSDRPRRGLFIPATVTERQNALPPRLSQKRENRDIAGRI